jgi:uncharacterized protein (DUF2141 family)
MRGWIVMLLVVLGMATTGLKPCATGFACATAYATAAQRTGSGVLTVKVVGFRNAKGRVDVLLFNSPNGFPDQKPKSLDVGEVPIDPQSLTAEVVFRDLPPGSYAVTVLHDENMNRKLDRKLFGIPREGYGASMNPPKMRRAPRFDEAKFSLAPGGQAIQVTLIYY